MVPDKFRMHECMWAGQDSDWLEEHLLMSQEVFEFVPNASLHGFTDMSLYP